MDQNAHAVPAEQSVEQKKENADNGLVKGTVFSPEKYSKDPPLSVYEQIKGEPYCVKYFELTDWLVAAKNSRFDVEGILQKVGEVERFAIEEARKRGLIDSTESFGALMQDLKQKLKIHVLEQSRITFNKIHRYISRARGKSAYKK